MNAPVPELIETSEITAPWVEAVLVAAGHPDAAVDAITLTPIGAGNVSETVRIAIDYGHQPAGAPASLVAKFRPSSPDVHAHGLGSGAYHREIGAYRAISERSACRIPDAFHVAGDETNINLVIEDLTSSSVPGDQIAGCGPEDARAVLTELAHLHAAFAPQTDATAAAWPIRMAEVCDYWAAATRAGADAALQRFAADLPGDALRIVDAAGELVRPWYLLDQSRLTLTHGDPRVDNVLFEQVDGHTRAVLIDWQVTGLRNPMYDVGYFLSGSVPVEDRQCHEQDLLDHYLGAYAAVQDGYGREEALSDYRTQVLSGAMITLAAISVLPDNPTVNALILALLRRNCAAAADWDAIEATRERSGGDTHG